MSLSHICASSSSPYLFRVFLSLFCFRPPTHLSVVKPVGLYRIRCIFVIWLQKRIVYLFVVSVTCRVKSTDLKSASATKQKRAKKVTSVSIKKSCKSASKCCSTFPLGVLALLFLTTNRSTSYLPPHFNLFSSSVFMRCQLNRLQKGQMIDEWFPLSSHVPLKGIEPGSLRVRARYSMEKIMPEEEYNEFKEV